MIYREDNFIISELKTIKYRKLNNLTYLLGPLAGGGGFFGFY